jgi:hypothetical protein
VRESLRERIVAVCNAKISKKGPEVGLSFYAFFSNKNDDPELLMEAATWRISEQRLDHFEKATTVKSLIDSAKR